MLNLQNFRILDLKESEYDFRLIVKCTLVCPSHCPRYRTFETLDQHGKK